MAKKSKEEVEEVKKDSNFVPMIWTHKKVREGDTLNCFGLVGVANEDGFLVVQCPKGRVKNELKRGPKRLELLEIYDKRVAMEKELHEQFDQI